MKNLSLSLVLCFVVIFINNSYASIAVQTTPNGAYALSPKDIQDLSMKEIRAKIGHKLNWKEKIGIQLVKHKLLKAEKISGVEGSQGDFWGGFILGFFLPLLGILVALMIDSNNGKLIGGAAAGTLVCALIALIALVGLFNAWNK